METHRHKQSASTGDDRLYINIGPELVKHAQDMRKQAASWSSYVLPTLGGAAVGAGLGGLADYLVADENDEDPIWDGALGGALYGGAAGAVGNRVYHNIKAQQRADFDPMEGVEAVGGLNQTDWSPDYANDIETVALGDVLPSGYRDDAQQYASNYRKSNPRVTSPYRQDISDRAIDRDVRMLKLDDNEWGQLGAQMGFAPGSGYQLGGMYHPEMDMMMFPESDPEWGLEHELTHASQDSRKGGYLPQPYASDLQEISDAVQDGHPIRSVSIPMEEEAYLADIKRNYFKETGQHVRTPADARKALDWAVKNVDKMGVGAAIPGLESLLYRSHPSVGHPGSGAIQKQRENWIRHLSARMPGLVNTGNSARFGKTASVNDRLYINIGPELVKHAQDMRKQSSGLFYDTGGGVRSLTPDQARYNQNLSRILLSGGGGLALGGVAALVRAMKRPSVDHLANPEHSIMGGMELRLPQRRSVRRKPEEEEEDASEVGLAKAARGKNEPTGWLGDEAGQHTVTIPAAIAAGVGGFWSANALGDYIAKQRRKRRREEAVEDAKDEYEDSIADQFVDSKAASADASLPSSLDALYDDFEKIADGPLIDIDWSSIGDWFGDKATDIGEGIVDIVPPEVRQKAKNVLGGYGGVLATLALASGVPASMLAYNYARNQKSTRHPLNEAMRRRRAELARRRPQPVYLTPGEEVVHEEDEQPVIESV
jgi:hypothetical protein